jgi:hypothetical protein
VHACKKSRCLSHCSTPNANKRNQRPLSTMLSNQNPKSDRTVSLSSQELQEVRTISRNLRQVKCQMFLKQVEGSKHHLPVDSFRSHIFNHAVEEASKVAFRSRYHSLSSERTSLRSCLSFDDDDDYSSSSFNVPASSFNDSLRSIGALFEIEE